MGKLAFRLKTGSLRANFRDWLPSGRSKRAKIARKLDCSTWHPSFHTVCKNYETNKKAQSHKGLLLFMTPLTLSATTSEYHAVANGRDTPNIGRCWGGFWRPLDGENPPRGVMRRGSLPAGPDLDRQLRLNEPQTHSAAGKHGCGWG